MDNLNLENPEYVDKLENVEKADIIKENVEKILEFCLLKENRTLRRENMDAYKQKCMREFTFMHQKYPTLFFSLIENPTTFPIYRLEEMLSLKKRIETTIQNKIDDLNKIQKFKTDLNFSFGCVNFQDQDLIRVENFIDYGDLSFWLPDANTNILNIDEESWKNS